MWYDGRNSNKQQTIVIISIDDISGHCPRSVSERTDQHWADVQWSGNRFNEERPQWQNKLYLSKRSKKEEKEMLLNNQQTTYLQIK